MNALNSKTMLLTWLILSSVFSAAFFAEQYLSISKVLLDWSLLRSEGLYPLLTLTLFFIFILLERHRIASILDEGYRPTLSYAVYVAAAATLIFVSMQFSSRLLSLFPANSALAIETVVLGLYFQGILMLAAPRLSRITLPIFGLFILTSLIPPLASRYFEEQVSSGFIQVVMPVLHAAGYPVGLEGNILVLTQSSTPSFHLLIDSAAAGMPTYAIFIFLTALTQLHFRLDAKRAIPAAAAGLGALLLLVVGRTVLLVHVGYSYGSTELTNIIELMSFAAFSGFCLGYAYIFSWIARRQVQPVVVLEPGAGYPGPRPSEYVPICLTSAFVLVAQYLYTYMDPAMGILLSLGCALAVYATISLARMRDEVSEGTEVIALLFIYLLLVSSLPWFFLRQELLFPAVYSVVLALGFGYAYAKNMSLKEMGMTWGRSSKYVPVGVVIGVMSGAIEFLILRPSRPSPDFSLAFFLQNLVVMTFFVGLGEELLFRGLIQTRLETAFGNRSALFIQAVLFGIMHLSWRSPLEILFTFAAALVIGRAFTSTKSLVVPIIIHAVGNTVLLSVMPFLLA